MVQDTEILPLLCMQGTKQSTVYRSGTVNSKLDLILKKLPLYFATVSPYYV